MANVLVRVDVQNQTGPVALDGVTVRVYASDGTTFITEAVTGSPFAAGRVEFTLFGDADGDTYIIRFSLSGWRFPAGASQSILVTDPPTPDNDFGPYDAVQGSTAILASLVVTNDSPTDPIQDVQLRIYTSPADVFITQLLTNAQGTSVVPLIGSAAPGTNYIVRLRKDGVIFEEPTQTIAVQDPLIAPATNVFDFEGHITTFPESADADMCTVYGFFTDVSLLPARRLRFEFKPIPQFVETGCYTPAGSTRLLAPFHSDPTIVRNKILTRSVKADTDKDGFISVNLPRGGHFEVHMHGFEDPIGIIERIYVPELPSAQLIDLLYPFVQEVTVDTDPIAVTVGPDVLINFSVILSSTEVLEDLPTMEDLIEVESANSSIAQVTLHSATQIAVKGLAVGSTTVVVTRKEGPLAPRRPPVAALVFTPPVVNVT